MTTARQSLGKWGESIAAGYLEAKGYQIQERNARTPYGEIDLVAMQPDNSTPNSLEITVFVEVKTRSSTTFGFPEEAINALKQEHLLAAAEAYMQQHLELSYHWRVDVIAIQCLGSRKEYSLKHFENVFS
jgi:putative endonuclease